MLSDLTFVDYVGIAGSLVISAAYLAVSRNWVAAERPVFQLLNLAGALMILLSLYYRPNVGAIIIEVLWVGIAIFTLAAYWKNRR
ncbi:MAG: CBU_0592 family membrane protein [Boseongicola sp.]